VVGLTVDAPAVRAGDAVAAAARWFEADHDLDVVVVLDDWSRPVGLVDRACAAGRGQPKRTLLTTGRRPPPIRWPPGPWPVRPPTASTRWSASTTGATTWACSASSSSCTGS
jgi:hypothetical protein